MELRQAFAQLSEIREHLARTEVFRGYRSLTVAYTGVVGLIAAVAQAMWLSRPIEHFGAYLELWVGAATINVALAGIEVWRHARMATVSVMRRTTVFAVSQFLPCLVAGALLTLVVAVRARDVVWMLPGLWALLFSLGVFASFQVLSRAIWIAGTWYLACGILALLWGDGDAALSPWIMGISFGGGQLLTAAILYVTLERNQNSLD
jgi:hypothetical protein